MGPLDPNCRLGAGRRVLGVTAWENWEFETASGGVPEPIYGLSYPEVVGYRNNGDGPCDCGVASLNSMSTGFISFRWLWY